MNPLGHIARNLMRWTLMVTTSLIGLQLMAQVSIQQPGCTWSQILRSEPKGAGVVVPGDSVELEWQLPTDECVNYANAGYVALRIDPSYWDVVASLDLEVKLTLTVHDFPEYEHPYNNSDSTTSDITLRVCHRPDTSLVTIAGETVCNERDVYYIPSTYKFKTAIKDDTTSILSISLAGDSTYLDSLPEQFFIETCLIHDHHCEMDLSESPTILSADELECIGPNGDTTAYALDVSWGHLAYADHYELEWTFVDDYDFSGGVIGSLGDSVPYDFKNNSTRVMVQSNGSWIDQTYRISLVYDRGWLLYRLRGVSRDPENPEYLQYGDWSLGDDGQVSSVPTLSRTFIGDDQVLGAHERRKAWNYTSTYAEEGKRKEVVVYADGTSRQRQTVTHISTDSIIIGANTIYDRAGRAAITTLPTPIVTDECSMDRISPIRHYPNMVLDNDSSLFDWEDFDLDDDPGNSCDPVAAPTMTGLVDHYYSPQYALDGEDTTKFLWVDPHPFIPQSEGYPYQQVEYMPDNSGRVRRQGGVGPAFQLESSTDDHETRYRYTKPSQLELDRMFGPEVGYEDFYQKVITTDANGQVTNTYLDATGRTIATSISGLAPDALDALSDSLPPVEVTYDMMLRDNEGVLMNNSIDLSERTLRFVTTFDVPVEASYTFEYEFDALPTVDFSCAPKTFCFDCIYSLELELVDECQTVLWSVDDALVGDIDQNGDVDFVCGGADLPDSTKVLTLTPGAYTFSRTLSLYDSARTQYLDHVLAECVVDLDTLIDDYVSQVDVSDCDITCDGCVEALGTLSQFIRLELGTETDYYNAIDACLEPCNVSSWCETAYLTMLADMAPEGQYGTVARDDDGNVEPAEDQTDALSVFNIENRLQNKFHTIGSGFVFPMAPDTPRVYWRHPYLYSEAGGGYQQGYFDLDGGRALIRLDQYDTANSVVIPEVDPQAMVIQIGTEHFVHPEALVHVEDFVERWRPEWARSLLYLHPEFEYYVECLRYDIRTYPTDPHTSDSFDKLLMRTESFEDACAAGLIYCNADCTDPDSACTINWFSDTSQVFDPYFVRNVDGQARANALQDKWDEHQFISLAPNAGDPGPGWLTIIQDAAYQTRCSGQFGYLINATSGNDTIDCLAFGTLYTDGADEDLDREIRDQEWIRLRQMYLSAKYKIQKMYMDEVLLDRECDRPGPNQCIGAKYFNPWDYGLGVHYVGSTTSSLGSRLCQPCGSKNRTYYQDKDIRFADPRQQVKDFRDGPDPGYQMYLLTGQCPVATAVEMLLSDMAIAGDLDEKYFPIDQAPQFNGLYAALTQFEFPSPIPYCEWSGYTGTDSIYIELECDDDGWDCGIVMETTDQSAIDWDDVVQLQGLSYNGLSGDPDHPYGFKIYALVAEQVDSVTTEFTQVELDGRTCYDIGNCMFAEVCEPNALASDLGELWSYMTVRTDTVTGALFDDTLHTSDPIEGYLLSSRIMGLFNDGISRLDWSYDKTVPRFVLVDTVENYTEIHLDLMTIENNDTFDLALDDHWVEVQVITNVRSSHQNIFYVDLLDAQGDLLGTMEGQAWLADTAGVRTPLPMGECGPPTSPFCQTNDHLLTDALTSTLIERLEHNWVEMTDFNIDDYDLFASPNVTPLLQNHLIGAFNLLPDGNDHYSITGTTFLEAPTDTWTLDIGGTGCITAVFDEADLTDNIVSIVGPTFNDTADTDGYHHGFDLWVHTDAPDSFQVTFTIDCTDLLPCDPCSYVVHDSLATPQITQVAADSIVDCSTLPGWSSIPLPSESECIGFWERITGLDTANDATGDTSQIVTLMSIWHDSLNLDTNYWTLPTLQSFLPDDTTRSDFRIFFDDGFCPCAYSYYDYVFRYYNGLVYPMPTTLPMPMDEYCVNNVNECQENYRDYLQAIEDFNNNITVENDTIIPLDCSGFTAQELCPCVPEYLALIDVVLNDSVVTAAEKLIPELYDIRELCTMPPPCDQHPPIINPIHVADSAVNECEEALAINATFNAQLAHEQMVIDMTAGFQEAYDDTCLNNVLESLQRTYWQPGNMEEQYTLYYYDRAGNLVRTVPPEGVALLDVNDPADQVPIDDDRNAEERSYFTTHRMVTDHRYNSLGQLTRENVPDKENMYIAETGRTNGIPDHLKIRSSQFVDPALGHLVGDYQGPFGPRGLIYRTEDGGDTWQRMEQLISEDLRDVFFLNRDTAWAAGSDGVIMRTVDGGTTWDWGGPAIKAEYQDLNAVLFGTATTGLAVGVGKKFNYTSNGGDTYTQYTPASTGVFDAATDIALDTTTNYHWVSTSGTNGRDGQLMYSNDISSDQSWVEKAYATSLLDHGCLSRVSGQQAFVGGMDGLLMTTSDGGDTWSLLSTGTMDEFVDLEFMNDQYGLAIMDSSSSHVLRASYDGGRTWSSAGSIDPDWEHLDAYAKDSLTMRAVGLNEGRVYLLSMADSVQEVMTTKLDMPSSEADAVWVGSVDSMLTMILSHADTLFINLDLNDASSKWFHHLMTDSVIVIGNNDNIEQIEAKVFTGLRNVVGLAHVRDGSDHVIKAFKFDLDSFPDPIFTATHVDTNVVDMAFSDYEAPYVYVVRREAADSATSIERYELSATQFPPISSPIVDTTEYAFTPVIDMEILQRHVSGDTIDVVTLVGRNGGLVQAYGFDTNYVATVFEDHADDVRPLPYRSLAISPQGRLLAVGDKGMMVVKDTSTSDLEIAALTQAEALNTVIYNEELGLFQASGVNGYLHQLDTADLYAPTSDKLSFSDTVTSIAAYGDTAYLSLHTGSILYSTNGGSTLTEVPHDMGRVNALAMRTDSTSQVLAVGDRAEVHHLLGTMRVKVRDLHPPQLHDVHFKDPYHGAVIGDDLFNRYTVNSGASWEINRHDAFTGAVPVYTEVLALDSAESMAVGNNGSLGRLIHSIDGEQMSTTTINSGYFSGQNKVPKDILRAPDGKVFFVVQKGQASFVVEYDPAIRKVINNGGGTYTASYYGAIAHFDEPFEHILAMGNETNSARTRVFDVSGSAVYNTTISGPVPVSDATNVIPSGEKVIDMYWHDELNGYIITDAGKIYRSDPAGTTKDHLQITWTLVNMDDGIDQQTDSTKMRPLSVTFSTRERGFFGGHYTGTSSSAPNRYARTVIDEVDLFDARYWYDRLGRLVLSQNTKQQKGEGSTNSYVRYSFTLYDNLGRVTQTGEVMDGGHTTYTFSSIFGAFVGDQFSTRAIDENKLKDFVSVNLVNDRVVTWYDSLPSILALPDTVLQPQNLERRVAATAVYEQFDPDVDDDSDFDHASYYSYDIHGNVETLVQDIPELETMSGDSLQRYKTVQYDYDLISGNVKQASYQWGKPDQYHHRYSYDADNRIRQVHTSRDGLIWTNDATYHYYPHGPLARIELGDDHVQGIDHAYTLQGWLKAINGDTLSATRDMGSDGITAGITTDPHANIARDAYGLSLGYYQGDYQPINTDRWYNSVTRPIASDSLAFGDFRRNLYNGNISYTVSTLPEATPTPPTDFTAGPLATVYHYDQLNRLTATSAYDQYTSGAFTWAATNDSLDRYANQYTYDRNGNLLTLDRHDAHSELYDELSYHYDTTDTHTTRNRLYHWDDNIGAAQLTDSIHGTTDLADNDTLSFTDNEHIDRPTHSSHNYYYTAIGELEKDRRAGIDVSWTPRGKVKEVTRDTSINQLPSLEFGYGVSGERIAKRIDTDHDGLPDTYEHYVRDAQGNILAIYRSEVIDSTSTIDYQLSERPRYGSSRLGTDHLSLDPLTEPDDHYPFLKGYMHYELSDHLGNVHVTVSDRKLAVQDDGDTSKVGYFRADIISARDYLPFGASLANRSFHNDQQRFGFQNQEEDDEVYGTPGSSINYKYRMHDARLGRFLSIDPLYRDYPWNSPFVFSENRVIDGVELEGLEYASARTGENLGPVNEDVNNPSQSLVETNDANGDGAIDVYYPEVEITANAPIHLTENPQPNPRQAGPTIRETDEASARLNREFSDEIGAQVKIEEGVRRHQIYDPVMSGYYGGANQYPTIIEGAGDVAGPAGLVAKGLRKGIPKILPKTWDDFKRLKGKTFTEKAALWKEYKTRIQVVNKVITAGEAANVVHGTMEKVSNEAFDERQFKLQNASEKR